MLNAGRFVTANVPILLLAENKVKTSPGCNAGPRFVTVKVPPKVKVVTPLILLAVWTLVRFSVKIVLPASPSVLLTLAGVYNATSFTVTSDGAGGTFVKFV